MKHVSDVDATLQTPEKKQRPDLTELALTPSPAVPHNSCVELKSAVKDADHNATLLHQNAQDLIQRLSVQFRDTQELLTRARAKFNDEPEAPQNSSTSKRIWPATSSCESEVGARDVNTELLSCHRKPVALTATG